MSRRLFLTTFFITVLIGTLGLSFEVQRVEASGTIYLRADGSVDPSTAPISTVDNITYTLTDNIINESIVVQGDNIVVDGAGYTMQGNRTGTGIELSQMFDRNRNVTIKNVTIIAFECGIMLYHSSNNTVSGNNLLDNSEGLTLENSNNNNISENDVANNYNGIVLDESSNNTLRNNSLINNTYNFGVGGLWLVEHFINDVDTSNTVDGKPIYYWINRQNMAVPPDAGCVVLANCTGITAQHLNLTNGEGILLAFTTNSTTTKNNLTNNNVGISLQYSWNNTICENDISGIRTYSNYGIQFLHSSNNSIIGNNITTLKWNGINLGSSDYNVIIGNTVTACWDKGIILDSSSNNNVSQNNLANNYFGLELESSSNNTIFGNNITNNNMWDMGYGIGIYSSSSNNTITMNNITQNEYGIRLDQSSNNKIYHNNLIDNSQQANITTPGYGNSWDNGYPSGGNYWSDYNGTDANHDDIGDTSYIIDANNTDHYPLIVPEFPSFLILPLFMIATLLAVILCKKKEKLSKTTFVS